MLTPRIQIKNPVMFVTYLGAIATSLCVINEMINHSVSWFNLQITIMAHGLQLFLPILRKPLQKVEEKRKPQV